MKNTSNNFCPSFPDIEEIKEKAFELRDTKVKLLEDIYGVPIEHIDARATLSEWYDTLIDMANWMYDKIVK